MNMLHGMEKGLQRIMACLCILDAVNPAWSGAVKGQEGAERVNATNR